MKRFILLATLLLTMAWMQPATAATDIVTCWDGTRLQPVPGRWYKVASRSDDYWPGFSSRTPKAATLTPEPGMPQALGFATWQDLYDDINSPDGTISMIMLRAATEGGNGHANNYDTQILPAQGLAPEGIVSLGDRLPWIVFDQLAPPPMDAHPESNMRVGGMYLRIQHEKGPVLAFGWATDYRLDKTVEVYVMF